MTDNLLDDVTIVVASMRAAGGTCRIRNSHALLIVVLVTFIAGILFVLGVRLVGFFGIVEGNRIAGRLVIGMICQRG